MSVCFWQFIGAFDLRTVFAPLNLRTYIIANLEWFFIIGSLQLLFFASGVFPVNFSFSFPNVPRVASLPFFYVHVVKEKTKISSEILAKFLRTVWFC